MRMSSSERMSSGDSGKERQRQDRQMQVAVSSDAEASSHYWATSPGQHARIRLATALSPSIALVHGQHCIVVVHESCPMLMLQLLLVRACLSPFCFSSSSLTLMCCFVQIGILRHVDDGRLRRRRRRYG